MIEINLLPEELKVKSKIRQQEGAKTVPALPVDKLFVYGVAFLLSALVAAHFYLVFVSLSKNKKLSALNRQWSDLAPQRKQLEEFNKGSAGAPVSSAVIQQLSRKRVLWAQKLNTLSLQLPSGIWFNDITINAKGITIQGSVISMQKEEVGLIDRLMENLKMDPAFSADFSGFEISKIQKRNVGGYDIADFILIGTLKAR